jgi:hypothetical protein
MKVGFIVECGPKGAETEVIPFLAREIDKKVNPDVITLEKKTILKQECGKWAKALLERGCKKVIIMWDLLPDWGEYEGKGCQHDDRGEIFKSLEEVGLIVGDKRIFLICIHKMLEAWIIADERALSDFLSTKAHKVPVKKQKDPESIRDPKSTLISLFKKSGSRFNHYNDTVHAIKIIQRVPDLNRLRNCDSFRRFEEKLTMK